MITNQYLHKIKSGLYIITGLVFVFLAQTVSAQNPNQFDRNQQDLEKLQEMMANRAKKDTTKKERKPLTSYFFNDSLKSKRIFAWNVNRYFNHIDTIAVDTMMQNFEQDYPFFHKTDVGSAWLGNLGAASIPLNARLRPQYNNFQFVQAFDAYLFNPSKARFFNVKRPFTHLSYFESGQKSKAEEQLRVTHAQNISPSSGFNLDYKNRGTKGMYANQNAKDKNLSFVFSHTGRKYSAHAGYVYNMGDIRNNGGILRDSDVADTVYEDPANIDVRLLDSKTKFKGNSFFAVQSIGLTFARSEDQDVSISNKSSLFFGHSIEYSRYHMTYTDTKSNSKDFYKNWYINPNQSADTLSESLLENRLFMQIQPYDRNGILGLIDAGMGYATHKYYQFTPNQFITLNNSEVKRTDFYIYGSAQGALKKYINWIADAQYHLTGFRSQDMKLYGQMNFFAFIGNKPATLTLKASLEKRTPNWWYENYYSNHYMWTNNFEKETETRLEANMTIPHINFEIGISHIMTSDKIYYNSEALPKQYSGSVNVTGLFVRKDFILGKLHLNNRALFQWSNVQEVVPVPQVSLMAQYYLQFDIVKNVLRVQLGADGFFNSRYYAFGYNPATAQFYNQREKELGKYPYGDIFVNAKWKRMRILIKYQHFNEGLFKTRNSFSVLHYPMNRPMLKLGFSWEFYD